MYQDRDREELLQSFQEHSIDPAEMKVRKLARENATCLERAELSCMMQKSVNRLNSFP